MIHEKRSACWKQPSICASSQTNHAKNVRLQKKKKHLSLCFGSWLACLIGYCIVVADNLGYEDFLIRGSEPARVCTEVSFYDWWAVPGIKNMQWESMLSDFYSWRKTLQSGFYHTSTKYKGALILIKNKHLCICQVQKY